MNVRHLLIQGDARALPLAANSVQCVVTSPPYFALRDYGVAGQIGLEASPAEYIASMVAVFREVRRVLRPDGVLFLNIGDSYAAGGKGGGGSFMDERRGGSWQKQSKVNGWRSAPRGLKSKDLIGIPWMLAFALRDDGWYLRQDIIWSKPNPMPESVTDRCTKAHEYLFLLTKSARYYWDGEAVKEPVKSGPSDIRKMLERLPRIGGKNVIATDPLLAANSTTRIGQHRAVGDPSGRNRRSVWSIATQPYKGSHFATFPEKLVEPCILAGTSEKGCCPKCGAPWRRVVEKVTIWRERPNQYGSYRDINGQPDTRKQGVETKTTAWVPGCKCAAGDPIPCTVLDPFNGSGTTGAVAVRHGRRYVGVDLNPEYIGLAKERIGAAYHVKPAKKPRAPRTQQDWTLFGVPA